MKTKHDIRSLKSVRIDARTVIYVDQSIPNDEARRNYLNKMEKLSMRTESPRWKQRHKKLKEKENPVPKDIKELDASLDINDASIEEDTEDSEDL